MQALFTGMKLELELGRCVAVDAVFDLLKFGLDMRARTRDAE